MAGKTYIRNQGGVPEGALPKQKNPDAIPIGPVSTYEGDMDIELAEKLASMPGYENDPNVKAYNAYKSGIPSKEMQEEIVDFEQSAFGPLVETGEPVTENTEVNSILDNAFSEDPIERETLTFDERQIGITGEPIANKTVNEQARIEAIKQTKTYRQNNVASKIKQANEIDELLKQENMPLATRERAVGFIGSISSFLSGVDIIDPKIGPVENGLGRIVNKINEKEENSNNLLNGPATALLITQSLVNDSVMLAGKANRQALPEENVLDNIFEMAGLQSIESSDMVAFHDQEGLTGVKEGDLGRVLLQGVSKAVQQAKGNSEGISFDKADASSLEQGLVDQGLLVRAPYVVLNSKGEPTKKRKDLAEEHTALFMTRQLYDAIGDFKDIPQMNTPKLGAQAITDPEGGAISEGKYYKPRSKRAPKGLPDQRKNKSSNVFTRFSSMFRKTFRAHDTEVLNVQAAQITALSKYIRTPIDQRSNLPPFIKVMAEDMAIQHKVKLDRVNPNPTNKKEQLAYYNAVQKINGVSKQIADAANLQKDLPLGHRLGDAVFSTLDSFRQHITAFNSSEQNSKAHRSSLRGHDRYIQRNRILNSKSDSNPLISKSDLANFKSAIRQKGNITQDHYEIAFLLSAGRNLFKETRNLPDSELIYRITPAALKNFASKAKAFKDINTLMLNPKNLELLISDPSKLIIPPEFLSEVNTTEIKSALDLATGVDKKHAGQTQQLINAIDAYINTDLSKNMAKLHSLDLADMSSAGRLQALVHAGSSKGAQLVKYMGWFITQSSTSPESNQPIIDGLEYTKNNPRMFTMKNVIDVLKLKHLDKREKGEENTIEILISNILEEALNTTKAPEYADAIAKLSNLVLDYGMGLPGATETMLKSFSDFIQEYQNDYISSGGNVDNSPVTKLNDHLYSQNFTMEDVKEGLFDSFSTALVETSNLGYAQALQQTAKAAAMLNIPLVFTGHDGQSMHVGKVGRKPIFGESVIIRGKKDSFEVPSEGEIQDLPAAASDPSFIDATGTYSEPGPYTAAAQALGPFLGISTERALVTTAFDILAERLGLQEDIILDIHDQIGMAPLESMMFQDILNSDALRKVLKHDLPKKTMLDMEVRIKSRLTKLLEQDSMVLGPDSDFAELTEYFDMSYNRLIDEESSMREIKSPEGQKARRKRLIRQKNELKDAYDKKLWAPKDPRKVMDFDFKEQSRSNQVSFSVEPKAFVTWYVMHILKPAKSSSDRNVTSLGQGVTNLVEDMAKSNQDTQFFMKSGN